MGTTYTSTIQVKCLKEHTCLCCGAVYAYELNRKVTGSARNKEKAALNAQAAAKRSVERDVDPQPCPTCGIMQPDMIGQRRARGHKIVFWLAMIAFVVIVILNAAYAVQLDTLVWVGVAACAATVLAHFAIDLPDPNRNLESNRMTAEGRVASGAVKHQAGQFVAGSEHLAKVPKSLGHRMALILMLAAVALAAEPELMRRMKGWPLNADCYPPVVGAGDHTRIYMNDKIDSIKGYWRGEPKVTMHEAGAKRMLPVNAETNQNDWGSTINAKSSEKHSKSTPWVKVTIPADESLSGKKMTCDLNLKVTHPEMQDSTSFRTLTSTMQRSLEIEMAPIPGAGGRYNEWWWTGTVLGMGVILFCGLCLLWAARGLEKKAKPTRAFVPQAAGQA